jgi:hypothetical protein
VAGTGAECRPLQFAQAASLPYHMANGIAKWHKGEDR